MPPILTITPLEARRLAIICQRLDQLDAASQHDHPRTVSNEAIVETVRALGCVQIDAVRAVEATQLLVLWSRLGLFDPAQLDHLCFTDVQLFEYWAHAASILPVDEYPLHACRMHLRRTRVHETNDWMAANHRLQQHILTRLAADGPLPTDAFDDVAEVSWKSSGWTGERNVPMMLSRLWTQGDIMIAGRKGQRRYWHLTKAHLPAAVPCKRLSEPAAAKRAVVIALQALGVATPKQIRQHYTRGFYPELEKVLTRLVKTGVVMEVRIRDHGTEWPGPWYMLATTGAQLERLRAGDWRPRTALLSPFDNLICDRDRTEQFFDFIFRIEIYVPKAKRQYGYYVLPILHGDELIGRTDLKFDRKANRLLVNALYAEAQMPATAETGQAIAAELTSLAQFLGADGVVLNGDAPTPWRAAL